MPVYEYECEDCGNRFDIVATLAEKEAGLAPACTKCGRKRARQVFGRFTLLTSSKADDGPGDDLGDESMGDDVGFGGDGGLGDIGGAGLDDESEFDDLE